MCSQTAGEQRVSAGGQKASFSDTCKGRFNRLSAAWDNARQIPNCLLSAEP